MKKEKEGGSKGSGEGEKRKERERDGYRDRDDNRDRASSGVGRAWTLMYTADVASVADSITLGRAAAPSGWRSRPGSWRRPRGEGSEAWGRLCVRARGQEWVRVRLWTRKEGEALNG